MHVHFNRGQSTLLLPVTLGRNEGINFFSFIRGLIDQSYPPMALALNP